MGYITGEEFLTLIGEEIVRDEIREASRKNKNKRTRRITTSDYWTDTTWGRLYKSPNVSDITSYEGRKFRRRFRVDYETFRDLLVPTCRSEKMFNAERESKIPIEMKIMVALRILGRDNDADTCCELSQIGESTCVSIFKISSTMEN